MGTSGAFAAPAPSRTPACRRVSTKRALSELHVLVEHAGPFASGSFLFREREPFNAIAAVRAGTVKTCVFCSDRRNRCSVFTCPARSSGSPPYHSERYPCNAIAVDTVQLLVGSPFRRSRCSRHACPVCSSSCFACCRPTSARPRCSAGDFYGRRAPGGVPDVAGAAGGASRRIDHLYQPADAPHADRELSATRPCRLSVACWSCCSSSA